MSVSKEFLSLLGSSLRSDLEKTMERISKTFDWDAATEIYEGKNIMNIVERLRERSSVALSEEDVTHFNQAADEIERLREELEDMHRRERSTAIQQLGNEGQWCDLVAAKDDEIERLREALTHIFAFYPISVSEPHKTIRAMQDFALAALKEDE